MLPKTFAGLFLSTLFLTGCNDLSKVRTQQLMLQQDVTTVTLQSQNEAALIELVLANNSPQPYSFCLSPAGLNFTNDSTIVNSVCADSMSTAEKAKALFNCVSDYTSRCNQQNKYQEEPELLLSAYGCGYCSDINHSLMQLLGKTGIPARLYSLTGHVVAEAYYDSAWHMLDADRKFYVFDSSGAIASVDYISRHSQILQEYAHLIIPFSPWRSWKDLRAMYESRNDNYVSDTASSETAMQVVHYTLNQGDEIRFKVSPVKPFLSYVQKLCFPDLTVAVGMGELIHRNLEQSPCIKHDSVYYIYSLPGTAVEKELEVVRQQPCKASENLLVYYSADSLFWYFKGELDNAGAIHFSIPTNEGAGETRRAYFKFTPVNQVKPASLEGVEVHSHFIFSPKLFLNEAKCFNITGGPGSANVTGRFTEAGYDIR